MDIAQLLSVHVTILSAVLTFGLGTWVYFEDRHDARNVTFGGLLMAVSLWAFALVLWRTGESHQAAFWLKTIFWIGSLLPPLAYLSVETHFKKEMPPLAVQLGILFPNAILFWLTFRTPFIVDGGTLVAFGRNVFAGHFIAASLATVILIARLRHLSAERGHAALVAGTASYFLSVAFVLFFSDLSQESRSFFIGSIVLIASMFAVAVTLIHRRFAVDLRLVGIEMFILLALLVLIMNIVVSESVLDFTVRLIILIVLAFFGALTSKTMVKEVHRLREIERLQQQVMQMNGNLIEADKMKTRFMSFATHQLRAPIGGVRTYLDLMLDGTFGDLSPKHKEVVSECHDAMVRMHETVETFLNIAKMDMGGFELYKSDKPLGELAEKVVAEMLPLAQKKGLKLTLEVKPGLASVYCDHGKTYHVILNFIDNAIKYTEKGKITVRVSQEKENAVVRVKDSGVGLSAAEIKALFKQFSRGAEGIRLDPTGSGLGLFFAQKIVEAHGGEVIVASPGKGKGSTFGFRLPLRT